MDRAVVSAKLKQQYEVLHDYGWVARDGDVDVWRISLRIRGIDDIDYAAFTETLRAEIDPLLKAHALQAPPGAEVTVTGTAPIVFRARRSLLDNMLFGLGTDVVLIVVAVIVTTRSLLTGGVMFVLSVFPTTLVFGAMGLLGIVVDIGSVMTPCVAVGVTVDDVIHFLLCHRRGVRRTCRAAGRCGVSHLRPGDGAGWGIIGIRLARSLQFLHYHLPIRMLMLLLLTAGLVGNLWCFYPRLLAGPLGRWMTRGTPRATPVCGQGLVRPNSGPQRNLPATDSGDQQLATELSAQRDRPEGEGEYSAFSRQIQSIRS
jgi:hypothetical protein